MNGPGLCVSGGEVKVGSRARLMLVQCPLEKESTMYWFQGNDMCFSPCFPALLLICPATSFGRVHTPSAFQRHPCQLLLSETLNHESITGGQINILYVAETRTWLHWVWPLSLLVQFALTSCEQHSADLPHLVPHLVRCPTGNPLTLPPAQLNRHKC